MISEKQYLEAKRIIEQYDKEQREYNKPKQRSSSISKEQWGVHINHCCSECGCKYGNDDCPVELDLVKQEHFCMDCYAFDLISAHGR